MEQVSPESRSEGISRDEEVEVMRMYLKIQNLQM